MIKFTAFLSIHTLNFHKKSEIEFLRSKSPVYWSPIFMIFFLIELFVAINLIADDFLNFEFLRGQVNANAENFV
jgi:hypothetical protein